MRIKALHFRNYRGLSAAGLPSCSGFNVLIGKNNSGKSSILAGLETVLNHLDNGRFSYAKAVVRPADEFTNRDTSRGFQIGLQIEIDEEVLSKVKSIISNEIPTLEKAVSSIKSSYISILFDGIFIDGRVYTYLSKMGFAEIKAEKLLKIEDNIILDVPRRAAIDIVKRDQEIAKLVSELEEIDPAIAELPSWEYVSREQGRGYNTRLRNLSVGDQIIDAARGLTSKADFDAAVAAVKATLKARVSELDETEALDSFGAFGGSVKTIPTYVYGVLEQISAKNVVHFRETRAAIGYEEAAQLLQLKTRRGGAERLATVQRTVKALLGVNVDAFEPEIGDGRRARALPRRAAEMDVDNFLVEANGAGIREALRIVLDIELKNPDIVLIEEPEVHLHPGLERSLHNYLTSKKTDSQIFVSTHSTNFIDVSDVQSVFVLTRDADKTSRIEQISSKEDLLKVPDEIGLRPSTILMFDRLIFVEGPSDEAIISALSDKLNVNLAQSGAAFVKMGGASSLPHYAAEATLDLLSRRQIPMWFIIDRDEQSDEDVEKILKRLGNRAHAVSLKRRELENYLLDSDAICAAMANKARHSEIKDSELPTSTTIAVRLKEIAEGLRDEVKRLNVERAVLKPMYPSREQGDSLEKIKKCQQRLSELGVGAEAEIEKIHADVDVRWEADKMSLVPGSAVLELLYEQYGLKYDKAKDGRRIADAIEPMRIPKELAEVVTSLVSDGK